MNIFAIQIVFLDALDEIARGCHAWKPSVHPLAATQDLFGLTLGEHH